MRRWWWKIALIVIGAVLLYYGYRETFPSHRVDQHSELVMLGDLDGDHRWTQGDRGRLQALLANPYAHGPLMCLKTDLNRNGRLDAEDLDILDRLIQHKNPYAAEAKAIEDKVVFPRPRELYRYVSSEDYLNRPLHTLPYPGSSESLLDCVREGRAPGLGSPYAQQLWEEVRDEAIRFDLAYRMRRDHLTSIETSYAEQKIERCNELYREGQDYELLLELLGMVEDAETLTTLGQDSFVAQTLFLRDHLRQLLASPEYAAFQAGQRRPGEVLGDIEKLLKQDLGLELKLEQLGPPRDLKSLRNYLTRTQWQYYKLRAKSEQLAQLIRFAQQDRRYLRAVSKTSRRSKDPGVQNHNLPMILLFREALRICGGDKKAAVGLLDEAIRIPFGWVKGISKDKLPTGLALENFLLPGNKEDGSDKSRHWNVFGGISLYKSPRESLDLALKREIQDLREAHYSPVAMTEFIRDTIANLNGIYYIVSMDPELLRR